MPEVVVVGAGPGGLAAAAMLRKAGVTDTLILERADAVAPAWRNHYERLHLHTVRWLSNLPGYKIPKRYGKWVARDDVVRYLEQYAAHHRLDIHFGVTVDRIERASDGGSGWVLRTSDGFIEAGWVVIATGHNHTPVLPDWPGREQFTGEVLHASSYQNPTPYTGRDVLVVGSGNTGAEIAVDLAEGGANRVRLSVRTPPHVMLREQYGVPALALGLVLRHLPTRLVDALARHARRLTLGDLTPYGLPEPDVGLYTRVKRDDAIPLIDAGLLDTLKKGAVTIVAGVTGFDGADVLLADGSRMRIDVVIAATGYRRGLDDLVGHLGVLDRDGRPLARREATHPNAPRMYFTGYTNPISGMFRELGIDARRIARAIAKERTSGVGGLPGRRRAAAAAAERVTSGA